MSNPPPYTMSCSSSSTAPHFWQLPYRARESISRRSRLRGEIDFDTSTRGSRRRRRRQRRQIQRILFALCTALRIRWQSFNQLLLHDLSSSLRPRRVRGLSRIPANSSRSSYVAYDRPTDRRVERVAGVGGRVRIAAATAGNTRAATKRPERARPTNSRMRALNRARRDSSRRELNGTMSSCAALLRRESRRIGHVVVT